MDSRIQHVLFWDRSVPGIEVSAPSFEKSTKALEVPQLGQAALYPLPHRDVL
jgi:hypothetical protein